MTHIFNNCVPLLFLKLKDLNKDSSYIFINFLSHNILTFFKLLLMKYIS